MALFSTAIDSHAEAVPQYRVEERRDKANSPSYAALPAASMTETGLCTLTALRLTAMARRRRRRANWLRGSYSDFIFPQARLIRPLPAWDCNAPAATGLSPAGLAFPPQI